MDLKIEKAPTINATKINPKASMKKTVSIKFNAEFLSTKSNFEFCLNSTL